jgi:hypothetical protein
MAHLVRCPMCKGEGDIRCKGECRGTGTIRQHIHYPFGDPPGGPRYENVSCNRCRGTGREPCTHPDCRGGTIEVSDY